MLQQKRHWRPLTRYEKLRIAHEPGMPGTFSPPPRVSDNWHGSRHVRDARAVMHARIANKQFPLKSVWREKRSGHSWRMLKPQFHASVKTPIDYNNEKALCCPHAMGGMDD